jgi:hypothetical protein
MSPVYRKRLDFARKRALDSDKKNPYLFLTGKTPTGKEEFIKIYLLIHPELILKIVSNPRVRLGFKY